MINSSARSYSFRWSPEVSLGTIIHMVFLIVMLTVFFIRIEGRMDRVEETTNIRLANIERWQEAQDSTMKSLADNQTKVLETC